MDSAVFCLHPENPRYFLFRDQPTVLLTSADHYGAVIHRNYDYAQSLRELARHGLNHARLFVGPYREVPGDFGIQSNLLGPSDEDYIGPFVRTQAGLYDLDTPNPAFFTRLEDYVRTASGLGIVVEINLFCPFYHEGLWDIFPMRAANNLQGAGGEDRWAFHSLADPRTLDYQRQHVRRVLQLLNGFDNLYYEIMNEPWMAGDVRAWELDTAAFIAQAEAALPHQHLISLNPANGWERLEPLPHIDIYNFHYASPPTAVTVNHCMAAPIGCNETGFAGSKSQTYRRQAWAFLMAGGALFNNLDYSFAPGRADGNAPIHAPGSGGRRLRRQYGILKRFMDRIDFVHKQPTQQTILRCHTLHGAGYCLKGERDMVYYFQSDNEIFVRVQAPGPHCLLRTLDPVDGIETEQRIDAATDGTISLQFPNMPFGFKQDIALHLIALDE